MPRTRSLAWSELKVGIAGAVAFLLLALAVVLVGGEGGYFWQRYPLKARFDNVQGLKEGAVVRLSGKEIGTVTAVDFAGAQVEVEFEVLKTLRPVLTTEAVAQIGSLSLLGEPVIDITAGTGGTPLDDYGYVQVRQSAGALGDVSAAATTTLTEVNALLADLRQGQGTLGRILTDDALYTELQALITAAGGVARSLETTKGTMGSLINDPAAYQSLKASLENLQTLTARINEGQGALGRLVADEQMGQSLANTTDNLAQITRRLSAGEGTAGRLLTDEQLYERLDAMVASINEVTAGLSAGRGTAGQLLHDEQLYENMNNTVVEFRALLEEIKKDPRKYLNIRISIF